MPTMAVAFPAASPPPQIQLDACIMSIDPAAWEQAFGKADEKTVRKVFYGEFLTEATAAAPAAGSGG